MARIKGVDIPNDKRIEISLTYIYGIGRKLSKKILKNAKVDLNKKTNELTEDELLTIIDEIEEEGKIKPYEKDLISSAIKFDDIEVKDIVTPRKDITAIDMEMSFEEIHKIFDESKYTRIPVYSGTIDNVIGILHEKDFYSYLLKYNNDPSEFKVTNYLPTFKIFLSIYLFGYIGS